MKPQNNLVNFNTIYYYYYKILTRSAIFQFLIKKSAVLYPPPKTKCQNRVGGLFSVIFIKKTINKYIYKKSSIVLINLLSL